MDSSNGDFDDVDDYEEQVEQLILENGMLLHAVVNLLIEKGVISREDLDGEIESLYQQAEDSIGPPEGNA